MPVSTETTGSAGTNTYDIAENYQSAGTRYVYKISSAHNAQITKIEIYKKESSEPTPEATALELNESTSVQTEYYAGDAFSTKGLAAIATFANESIQDVTEAASWSCEPATIAEDTKSVTVTATYKGLTASKTYDITVKSIANTAETAYTVEEAVALIDANKGLNAEVYVKGIVSKVDRFNSTYGSINYYISNDGTEKAQQFECYGGLNIGGEKFASIDDVEVGAQVVVKGKMKKYNSTYELDANNELVSYQMATKVLTTLAIAGTPAKLSYSAGEALSAEGLTVEATFDDGTTQNVTGKVVWTFTPETITENCTVTAIATYQEMSASTTFDVTVKPNYTITWSVNGVETTTMVEEGNDIAFTTPTTGIPENYEFMGWYGSTLEATDEAPEFVTSATATANTTYYAVFAKASGSAPVLTKMTKDDTFVDGDKVVIVAKINETLSYGLYQEVPTGNTTYVKNFVFTDEENGIAMTATDIAKDSKYYLTVSEGTNAGTWILGDDENGYLYSNTSNNLTISKSSKSDWTLISIANDCFNLKTGTRYLSCRSDLSADNQFLYRLGGTGATGTGIKQFDIYKFVSGTATYSGYTTSVTEEPFTPVSVTISDAGYATLCLPYAGVIPTGVKAYAAKDNGTTVTLTERTDGVIAAKEGVVLQGAAGTYSFDPYKDGAVEKMSDNEMVGVTEATPLSTANGVYLLSRNKTNNKTAFRLLETDYTLGANKAYLKPASVSYSRLMIDIDDNVETGIDAVNGQEDAARPKVIYNLAGQRMSRTTKGINIVNGKLVLQ